MALRLCDACERHVRDGETRCPFCDAPLTPVAITPRANARLSRAAQMAFVAAVAIGCEETKPPNAPTNAEVDAAPPPPIATIEPPPAATTATTSAPTTDAAGLPPPDIAKPYGAPPAAGLLT